MTTAWLNGFQSVPTFQFLCPRKNASKFDSGRSISFLGPGELIVRRMRPTRPLPIPGQLLDKMKLVLLI